MALHRSEHSAPFHDHRSSTSTMSDADWKESEELLDPRSFSEKPTAGPRRKFQIREFLSKMIGWPTIVICGQLILQIAAWSFFVVVQRREFIALPYTTAVWVKAHGRLVTVIFTGISTALAACSSFLFSWGAHQSIALHLHGEGLSLATFMSTIKISSRSLILDHRKRRWSAVSILLLVLTGLQTSGWSSVLTPQVFEIDTPLIDYEIDLASPLLQPLQSQGKLDFCVVNSRNQPAFYVGQTESGYAAMRSSPGSPASLQLMDQTFNVSTAGILPLTLRDVDANSWFLINGKQDVNNEIIPGNITSAIEIPDSALSASYSMVQQGFTAGVTCQFADLTDQTTPSFSLLSNETAAFSLGDMTHFQMFSDCLIPGSISLNYTNGFALDDNYVFMIACGGLSDSENYTLIYTSGGKYQQFLQTMVCTLEPKITRVQVDYMNGGINTTLLKEGAPADVAGTAGLSAVTTIHYMQLFAQAVDSNVVGEELLASILHVDPGLQDGAKALSLMENYIRGVAEYSGSILRACLSTTNVIFPDRVPVNMSIPSEGVFHSEFAGWTHVSSATFWVLLPGTFVAISTILIVLVAVAHHAGDPEGEPFDPTNAMHLVSASAAGGLDKVFTDANASGIKAVEGVNIVLEAVDGCRPALKVRGV